MSFNARITFTGICTFVPNQEGSRFYVLMPNGEQALGTGDSIDGTLWKRHRGFMRFNVKDLAYAHDILDIGEGVIGVMYFNRSEAEGGVKDERGTELTLNCPEAPKLTVEEMPIADLARFAPEYSTIDSDLITKKGKQIPDTISMRMLISQGALKAGRIVDGWRIPNTLNTGVAVNSTILGPQPLVHEVVLELKDLNSLNFSAYSIPGGGAYGDWTSRRHLIRQSRSPSPTSATTTRCNGPFRRT